MKSITNAIPSFRQRARKSYLRQDSSASKLHLCRLSSAVRDRRQLWLRFMLDSHPQMAIPPETGFFFSAHDLSGHELDCGGFLHRNDELPSWLDYEIPEALFCNPWTKISHFTFPRAIGCFTGICRAFAKPRWETRRLFIATTWIRSEIYYRSPFHSLNSRRSDAALS